LSILSSRAVFCSPFYNRCTTPRVACGLLHVWYVRVKERASCDALTERPSWRRDPLLASEPSGRSIFYRSCQLLASDWARAGKPRRGPTAVAPRGLASGTGVRPTRLGEQQTVSAARGVGLHGRPAQPAQLRHPLFFFFSLPFLLPLY
jgi:hypothetical protein